MNEENGLKNMSFIEYFNFRGLTSFPFIERTFDAMDTYQLLSKIVEYLNNVIKSQNEVNNNMNELIKLYNELKSYVDNYFTNLDVQQEIDNKLNEMVADGTLQSIIDKFLNISPLTVFNTVADLKNSDQIIEGLTVKTNGFYEIGQGSSQYIIANKGINIVNEMDILSLKNENLVAIKINKGFHDIESYGAEGDGTTDNTSILKYILEVKVEDGDVVHVPKGIFSFNELITCNKTITLEGVITAPYVLDYCCLYNTGTSGIVFTNRSILIKNINFKGIKSNIGSFGFQLKNIRCKIKDVTAGYFNTIGIRIGDDTDSTLNLNHTYLENVLVYQCDIGIKTGIPITGDDKNITNCNDMNFINSGVQISRIGFYLWNGSTNKMTSCYTEGNTEYGYYLENFFNNTWIRPYMENVKEIYFDETSENNLILGNRKYGWFESSFFGNVENNDIQSNLQSKGVYNIWNQLKTQAFKIAKNGVAGIWNFIHDTNKLKIEFSNANGEIDMTKEGSVQSLKTSKLIINSDINVTNTSITGLRTAISPVVERVISSKSVYAHIVPIPNIINGEYYIPLIAFKKQISNSIVYSATFNSTSNNLVISFYNTSDSDILFEENTLNILMLKHYSN